MSSPRDPVWPTEARAIVEFVHEICQPHVSLVLSMILKHKLQKISVSSDDVMVLLDVDDAF